MKYTFWIIIFAALFARLFHYHYTVNDFPDGTKLRITDTVTSEPIRYETSQYIKLNNLKIYLPKYPEVYYRDEITVEGIVDGDVLKNPKVVKVTPSAELISNFRKNLIAFYQRSLPQPHAALLAGVVIGSKSDIPESFWESLKSSGTAHVVVASGMNITLVAKFLISSLILIMKRKWAILATLLGIWVYALLAGFDAPIIRAAIMGSLVFTAQELGKLVNAMRVLILTGIGMLIIKPEWLTDLGFVLSFLATASILIFEPRINLLFSNIGKSKRKALKLIPKIFWIDLATTTAAQIGVAPVLFASFGQFNILSPIINALVLWTIVPITIIGMIGGIAGLIFKPIGTLILWLTYPLTSWFIFVIELF